MIVNLPTNPCAICKKNEATQLCDFVTDYIVTSIDFKLNYLTCDLPICKECARQYGPVEFCPYHNEMFKKVEIPDGKMQRRINEDRLRRWERADEDNHSR